MHVLDHIQKTIRGLRKRSGWNQATLARNVGVATNTVSRWETGEYRPGIVDLMNLASMFGVSVLTFFPDDASNRAPTIQRLVDSCNMLADKDIQEVMNFVEYKMWTQAKS